MGLLRKDSEGKVAPKVLSVRHAIKKTENWMAEHENILKGTRKHLIIPNTHRSYGSIRNNYGVGKDERRSFL